MSAVGVALLVGLLLVNLCFARRPQLLLALPLALWVAIPNTASTQLSGIQGISIGTEAAIAMAASQVLTWTMLPRDQKKRVRVPGFLVLAVLLCLGALMFNYVASGSSGLAVTVDMIVGPLLWTAFVGTALAARAASVRLVFIMIQASMVVNVGVAALQRTLGYTPFFREAYLEQVRWYDEPLTRAFGLMDSAVALGLLCALAVPLSALATKGGTTFLLSACALGGVLLSQSRVAFVLSAAGIAYIFLSQRLTLGRLLAAFVAGFGAIFIATSDVAAGVLGRFDDDNGSARLRDMAYDYFLSMSDQLVFSGQGGGSGVSVQSRGILESSLENGYLIFAYDYGIVFAACFAAFQIIPVLRGIFTRGRRTIAFAAMIAIVSAASFSSIAVASTTSVLVLLLPLVLYGLQTASTIRESPRTKATRPALSGSYR